MRRTEAASLRVDAGRRRTDQEAGVTWAILALKGVPLGLWALAIMAAVFRTRALRKPSGNIPVRVLRLTVDPA
jgi:hypothetical protein